MEGIEIREFFEKEFGRKIGKPDKWTVNRQMRDRKHQALIKALKEGRDHARSNGILFVYALLMVSWFCLLATSCTTVRYVPIESTTHVKDSLVIRDSVAVHNVTNVKDSVAIRDSVVMVVDEQGKVIRTELYRYKETNRNLTREIDSLKQQLKDAESQTVEHKQEPVYIEKPLSRWQRFKLKTGEIGLTLLFLLLVKAGFNYRHRHKH